MRSSSTRGCLTLPSDCDNPRAPAKSGPVMDVFALFAARITDALRSLYPEVSDEALARLVAEPPRDPGHGDLSSNAAMVVAKPLGVPPRDVAAALAARFADEPDVQSVEVAGPGFLNFRLADSVWLEVLRAV